MVAEGVLAAIGYDVDMAGDGLEALRRLDAATYDAVLMDCHMPLMDGFQATAEIRRREGPDRRTPVIAMTAGVLAEDRERCLAAGMDDFVPKPVDAALLEATLARWTASGQSSPDVGAEDAAGRGDAGGGVLDPARIAMLRGVGAQDGWGLLPALTANFLQEGTARLAALQAAVDAVQPHVLAEAAHSLKGMAGTIGAVQVAALCADLEALGRAGRTAPADALDRLGAELVKAQDALVGMLPGPA
jgi:CheY-like chemotaxis protein/HPt (histidine-containing phosphotransfer) domain-containing protein